MTPDQTTEYEERAAIMEFDGRLPRDDAERRARKIIEGRDKPEQLDLGMELARSNFRAGMRKIWSDY